MDFAAHNEEVRQVRQAYEARQPIRVPVEFNLSMRYFIANPAVNVKGVTWRDFSEDPEVMFDMYMRRHHFVRYNVVADWEMGPPEKEWPGPHVDFQNIYEAVWLAVSGTTSRWTALRMCPSSRSTRSASTTPRSQTLARGLMGAGARVLRVWTSGARTSRWRGAGGKPPPLPARMALHPGLCPAGPTEVCLDMYEDELLHDLMDFVMGRAW